MKLTPHTLTIDLVSWWSNHQELYTSSHTSLAPGSSCYASSVELRSPDQKNFPTLQLPRGSWGAPISAVAGFWRRMEARKPPKRPQRQNEQRLPEQSWLQSKAKGIGSGLAQSLTPQASCPKQHTLTVYSASFRFGQPDT